MLDLSKLSFDQTFNTEALIRIASTERGFKLFKAELDQFARSFSTVFSEKGDEAKGEAAFFIALVLHQCLDYVDEKTLLYDTVNNEFMVWLQFAASFGDEGALKVISGLEFAESIKSASDEELIALIDGSQTGSISEMSNTLYREFDEAYKEKAKTGVDLNIKGQLN